MTEQQAIDLAEQIARLEINASRIDELYRERRWRAMAECLAEIQDSARKSEWAVNGIIYEKERHENNNRLDPACSVLPG